MSCPVCGLGEHEPPDCELYKHMTGVRWDAERRLLFWSICTEHGFWSVAAFDACPKCHQRIVAPITELRALLDPVLINAYLLERGLLQGFAPISAALLQRDGTGRGKPAVMLVCELEGKPVLAKTTLAMLETVVRMMRAALEDKP